MVSVEASKSICHAVDEELAVAAAAIADGRGQDWRRQCLSRLMPPRAGGAGDVSAAIVVELGDLEEIARVSGAAQDDGAAAGECNFIRGAVEGL